METEEYRLHIIAWFYTEALVLLRILMQYTHLRLVLALKTW